METEPAERWPPLQKFSTVQDILDQNKILIAEVNHNHDTRTPEALARNVILINELNSNISKVVQIYKELSSAVM
ncbi:hypothetical protein WJX73_000856 [Symbiochloris irregularis]|uniref:Protein EARLY FLOWERING 4 domain-containing protein n=1 Tax=Symbiochloris irregularis TaxID=706552 RepID=A0AAW1P8J9_9CHLO